jgi:hypothetical protein
MRGGNRQQVRRDWENPTTSGNYTYKYVYHKNNMSLEFTVAIIANYWHRRVLNASPVK